MIVMLLGMTASFNWLVDPFSIYQSVKINHFNSLKTQQEVIGKFTIKAICALEQDYSIFILGSSRANRGIDPTHPAFNSLGKAYNIALTGANVYELKQVIDFILTYQPYTKIIVFSLDFLMFTDRIADNPNFEQSPFATKNYFLQHIKNTFSLDETYYSLKTVIDNYQMDNTSILEETPCIRQGIPKHDIIIPYPHYKSSIKTLTSFLEAPQLYAGYCYSHTRLLELQQIIDTARQHHIEVKFFISPIHAWQLELIRLTGLYPTFEQWKRDLTHLLAQDQRQYPQQPIYPLYDFSSYHELTTESVPRQQEQQMQWFWESSHYKKQLGNLVINKLFHYQVEQQPADFGILIDEQNIETHLAHIRQAQQRYQQTHDEDMMELTALVKAKFHKISIPCPE